VGAGGVGVGGGGGVEGNEEGNDYAQLGGHHDEARSSSWGPGALDGAMDVGAVPWHVCSSCATAVFISRGADPHRLTTHATAR
jgi:hypothetical protein